MIAIISPAKNMKRISRKQMQLSKSAGLEKTAVLAEQLKKYQPWELEGLMKINEQLAEQAFMDFQDFSFEKTGQAALLSYDGLVFKQIKAEEFSCKQLQFANQSVRILSAFYGLLRPMDEILPYRLEMQCKLKIEGESLYHFWKQDFYQRLYEEKHTIVNLASEEYAKCVRKHLKPEDRFVDIEFLVNRKGKLRSIATWAKMARGQMIRYIIENKIQDCEDLKEFEWNGYEFEDSLSYHNKYVFLQK